jgi:hypothetical protein
MDRENRSLTAERKAEVADLIKKHRRRPR